MNDDLGIIGARSFLAKSQEQQEKLHDNADSIIYLRLAVKNLVNIIEGLVDRVEELERKVNRVPGSIPGDYTWDELVGKRDD